VQAGARIKLRRARDIAPEERIAADAAWQESRDRMHLEYAAPTLMDAEWADAIAFGTPTTAGTTSPEVGAYVEWLSARGTLKGRICSAFGSEADTPFGSAAIAHLQAWLLRDGMTVLATSLPNSGESDNAYKRGHQQGRGLVELARAVKQARNV
jgi:multimeric flavodoxin WrbA